jgi:TM2 domain-containing membrane protein YozV
MISASPCAGLPAELGVVAQRLFTKGYPTVSEDSPLPANKDTTESEPRVYQLKNPGFAALLAWLVPGLGHMYQGRWAKGILFFVCIFGTFFYGIALGSSRVVYTSMRPYDQRYYYYVCQAGVGLPALPALVQAWRVRGEKAPFWNGWMAPPVMIGQAVPADWARAQMALGKKDGDFEEGDFLPAINDPEKMVYVYRGSDSFGREVTYSDFGENEFKQFQLSIWHAKYSFKYDLGTTFTMVAGLLNILVIFDAFAGPMLGNNLSAWEAERKRREALAEKERAEQKRAKATPKSGT